MEELVVQADEELEGLSKSLEDFWGTESCQEVLVVFLDFVNDFCGRGFAGLVDDDFVLFIGEEFAKRGIGFDVDALGQDVFEKLIGKVTAFHYEHYEILVDFDVDYCMPVVVELLVEFDIILANGYRVWIIAKVCST